MGDLFAPLLELEDTLVRQGFQYGLKSAERAAFEEGRELGIQKGAEVGNELGWYFGHLVFWEQTLSPCSSSRFFSAENKREDEQGESINKRIVETLRKLRQLLETFPSDPTKEDLFDHLDRVRGKYRQAASLLKAPLSSRYVPPSSASHTPTSAAH